MASAIPSDLRQQVEQGTGCVIAAEVARGGGGASRQGAEITLRAGDGSERHCYLAWDLRAGDPSRLPYFVRETSILRALSGPFAGSGIRAAPLIGSYPSHLALLSAFIPGNDRFAMAEDKAALATDFVKQLAALHKLDAADPAFAELGDASELPSQRITANVAKWQATNLAAGADPILQIALDWLARHVPEDAGPVVVLHGDAGPGNFLFEGNCVAALIDWELTHLGDPAEDLAQIWVRSLIQPFVPMRDVLAAYAAASRSAPDLARIKYHRLYFQMSFLVAGAAAAAAGSQVGASASALLYGTMHRRVIVRALAELSGITLVNPPLPQIEADWTDPYFSAALETLKIDILPAAADQRGAAKAKDLARLVKFWRRRASHGAAFDAAEISEIKSLLPTAPSSLIPARAALGNAIAEGAVDFSAALQLCHNRALRETFVMADAMGALATTWYEDIG